MVSLPTLMPVWALLLCLSIGAVMASSPRFYEDCQTSTMRIKTKTRFVGGDVLKSMRLDAGHGTLDCANKCKADEDCWSFNYEKNRKVCFLQSSTEGEATRQRAGAWTSGYRECVFNSTSWSNDGIEFPKGVASAPSRVPMNVNFVMGTTASAAWACTISGTVLDCNSEYNSSWWPNPSSSAVGEFNSQLFLYVADRNYGQIFSCPLTTSANSIDFSAGCSVAYSSSSTPPMTDPALIKLQGNTAYVVEISGDIFECTISSNGLTFTGCTKYTKPDTNVHSIAVTGSYLYILQGWSNQLTECPLANLANCVSTSDFQMINSGSLNNALYIAISGSVVYFSGISRDIVACTIVDYVSSRKLENCNVIHTVNSSYTAMYGSVSSLTVLGSTLYAVADGILSCTLSNGGLSITSCTLANQAFPNTYMYPILITSLAA